MPSGFVILNKDKNYLGLWRSSFLVFNSIGCLGGLLVVPELDPLVDNDEDAASEMFLPSPLNILEGFFIIRLGTLHGENAARNKIKNVDNLTP